MNRKLADLVQSKPTIPAQAGMGTTKIGVPDMPKVFPSHQYGMVGLVKQLLDHAMAPTVQGSHTRFAIEKLTVLTNIAIIHKKGPPNSN